MKKYFWVCSGLSLALFATALTVSLVNDNNTKKEMDQNVDDMNHVLEESKVETIQKLNALDESLKETKETLNTLLKEETKKLEDALATLKNDFGQADEGVLATLRTELSALESKLSTQESEDKKELLKQINDVKAALEQADAAINQSIKDLSDDLKKADKTNADDILTLKATFEAFCEEIEGKVSQLNTSVNASFLEVNETISDAKAELNSLISTLRNDLDEVRVDYLDSLQNLATTMDAKITEMKSSIQDNKTNLTSLQSQVETLSTSLNAMNAAMSTDISELRASLTELSNTILNSTMSNEIHDLKTWIDNFAGEAMINAKAVKVGEFFDFCNNIKLELKDTLLNELYNTDEASNKYNEIENKIDNAYQQGVVRISLSIDVDSLNQTVEDVQKVVDNIVEEFRVAVYKNTINDSFKKYRDETLNKVNAMTLSEEEYALLQKNIESVVLGDYQELQTSEKVKQVLLDAMFDVYKEYVKAWLIVTQNQGIDNMQTLKYLTEEEKVEYTTAVKNVAFSDSFSTILRQDNKIEDNIINIETNDAIELEKEAVQAKIDALCQLADNQNEETNEKTIYFEKWFDDEENGFLKYLTEDEVSSAMQTYLEIMEKYDYSINNQMTKDELVEYYQNEKNELASTMFNFEYAWKLSDKQVNANNEFEEFKQSIKASIKENHLNLTDDEISGYSRMIDIVVLPDVSEFNTLEEIDVIEKEKRTLVNNVYLLATCQNGEYNFIQNGYAIFDSSRYMEEFSIAEIDLAKNEISNLDNKYSYSIDNIFEIEDTELLKMVESYTATLIEENYKLEQSDLEVLTTKFDVILNTREQTQQKIDDINDKGVIFGEAVSNDFGLEIRLIGEFEINDINDSLDSFKARAKEYLASIDNVYTKASELHKALTNTHTVIRSVSSYQTTNGLTEAEINEYIKRIYNEGYAPDSKGDLNSEELYNLISAEGADVIVLLNTYTKKVNDIGVEAKVLYDARNLSFKTENDNLAAMNQAIYDFNQLYNAQDNLTIFDDASWTALTNEIQNTLKAHTTTNCKTPQEVMDLDARFDEKLVEWKNKVDTQYKELDKEMLDTTITQTIDDLEAYILELRKIDANKSKDIEILQLRKEYKEIIRECEYSFEVAQKYAELKDKLAEVLAA